MCDFGKNFVSLVLISDINKNMYSSPFVSIISIIIMLTDEYSVPSSSMQRNLAVATPLMTTRPGPTGRISIRPKMEMFPTVKHTAVSNKYRSLQPFDSVLQSVLLTVQSLDSRTTDLSTLTDQQVHSWSGGVKVPEPDHLGPAVGNVGPVV